jgi:hypothetical protein
MWYRMADVVMNIQSMLLMAQKPILLVYKYGPRLVSQAMATRLDIGVWLIKSSPCHLQPCTIVFTADLSCQAVLIYLDTATHSVRENCSKSHNVPGRALKYAMRYT